MADGNLDHPLVQKYLKHKGVADKHNVQAQEHQAKAELTRIQMRKQGLKVPVADHPYESDYVRVDAKKLETATNKSKKTTKKKAPTKKVAKKKKR